jgi:hypothetical protein
MNLRGVRAMGGGKLHLETSILGKAGTIVIEVPREFIKSEKDGKLLLEIPLTASKLPPAPAKADAEKRIADLEKKLADLLKELETLRKDIKPRRPGQSSKAPPVLREIPFLNRLFINVPAQGVGMAPSGAALAP